jgi:hypothetical protein
VFASGVVDPDQHALRLEELVDPGVDFRCRHRTWRNRRRCDVAASTAAAVGIIRVILRAHLRIVAPLGGRGDIDRHEDRLADQDDLAFRGARDAFQICGELRRRRVFRQHHLVGSGADRSGRPGRPGQHFGRQLILDRRGDVR